MLQPPPLPEIDRVVSNALQEDIGKGDITTFSTIPPESVTTMVMTAREPMVVCGMDCVEIVFRQLDPNLQVIRKVEEGEFVQPDTELIELKGLARRMLSGERVALNLFQHLSGIATLTKLFVSEVEGTKATILDTRKTTPGLRILEKYATRVGGATNHRMRLDDGVLIKDNHIAIAGSIMKAVTAAKEKIGDKFEIQVECDNLLQLEAAIKAGADRVLLDNMPPDMIIQAVQNAGEKIILEASGGITLENVREVAETGVHFISLGAITHSAPSVDIGLDMKEKS